MVKVEIIKKYLGNYPGSIIEVSEESAKNLINIGCGKAEGCDESKPKAKRGRKKSKQLAEDVEPAEDDPKVMTYKKWTNPGSE